MKRIIAVILTLILELSFPLMAFADEGNAFDVSVVEGNRLYEYDKFDRTWKIVGFYEQDYSDVWIVVGVLLFPEYIEEGWGPELRVISYDPKDEIFDEVKSFKAVIDDTIYTFSDLQIEKSINGSSAFGGTVFRQFVNSLETGKEIAFRIECEDNDGTSYSVTIDPVEMDALKDLIEMAYVLEKSNAWECDIAPKLSDYSFGAKIE